MEILTQSFGEYQTNCYICKLPLGEIVIDAGMGASEWVASHCSKPLAFLNTHGHFDHIWSNASLKSLYPNTPLIAPELDSFMLESDCFGTGVSPSNADILIPCHKNSHTIVLGANGIIHSSSAGENKIDENKISGSEISGSAASEGKMIEGERNGNESQSEASKGIEVKFSHYPGHTPGCSVVEIEGCIFSGDFIFHRSIGRSDFPYSNVDDMIESLQRFLTLPDEPNKPIYPGHGQATSIANERKNIELWIRYLSAETMQ